MRQFQGDLGEGRELEGERGETERIGEKVFAGSNQLIQPFWHRNFNLLDILYGLSSTFIKECLVHRVLAFLLLDLAKT